MDNHETIENEKDNSRPSPKITNHRSHDQEANSYKRPYNTSRKHMKASLNPEKTPNSSMK